MSVKQLTSTEKSLEPSVRTNGEDPNAVEHKLSPGGN